MKQTAVEWYENKINALFDKYEDKEISKSEFLIMKHNLFYPAKEMEKEQIVDVWIDAYTTNMKNATRSNFLLWANNYYNETYGGNK